MLRAAQCIKIVTEGIDEGMQGEMVDKKEQDDVGKNNRNEYTILVPLLVETETSFRRLFVQRRHQFDNFLLHRGDQGIEEHLVKIQHQFQCHRVQYHVLRRYFMNQKQSALVSKSHHDNKSNPDNYRQERQSDGRYGD
mmetsp:Transcript_137983/g.253817  ORF Transcript_137983/g.253817 Transcript_137983/m.253817 type:complete len:138 (-) Transcript_137983:474-887(-)